MAAPTKDSTKEMCPQVEESSNGQTELNISDNGEEDCKMGKEYSFGKVSRCADSGKAGTGFAGSDKLIYSCLAGPHFQKLSVFLTINASILYALGLPSFISSGVAARA